MVEDGCSKGAVASCGSRLPELTACLRDEVLSSKQSTSIPKLLSLKAMLHLPTDFFMQCVRGADPWQPGVRSCWGAALQGAECRTQRVHVGIYFSLNGL